MTSTTPTRAAAIKFLADHIKWLGALDKADPEALYFGKDMAADLKTYTKTCPADVAARAVAAITKAGF